MIFVIYYVTTSLWAWFSSLSSNLAVGLLTVTTTVIVTTVTLVVGKYFERVKKAEAHLRAQKISMYDEFLTRFFEPFHDEEENRSAELMPFLRGWQ